MKILSTVIIGALLLAFSCFGAVIYDNGAPDPIESWAIDHWVSADDFTFAEDTPVSFVRFWTFEQSAASFSGSVYYAIYADAGGWPNTGAPAVRDWTEGANLTRQLAPEVGPLHYDMTFQIAPFTAQAGVVYWLAIHDGDPTVDYTLPGEQMFWLQTSSQTNGSPGALITFPFDGSWFQKDGFAPYDLAFQLGNDGEPQATPEPATYALMGLGLAALAAAGRVRKQR